MASQDTGLPGEEDHSVSALGLGALLVMVLAAVIAVNAWAIRRAPAKEHSTDSMIVAKKWELASSGGPPGGVVAVGDSSGTFGVVPEVLAEALGRPALNACTYGRFFATGSSWVLDEAMEVEGAPPAMALVVLGSLTFVKERDGVLFGQLPAAPGRVAADALGGRLRPSEAGNIALARLFPLFFQSARFAKGIREGQWKNKSALEVGPRGGATIPAAYVGMNPEKAEALSDKIRDELRAHGDELPTPEDQAAIRHMIDEAQARGYDVVFVNGPIWEGLAQDPLQVEAQARIDGFLDEACAASDRAWHLPGPLQTFPADLMEHPFHLGEVGAKRFTKELAARLVALGLPR